jgi:phage terminase large subunit GpA-like protein
LRSSLELVNLDQLTPEKAVRKYKKGKGAVREYIKTRARNEALDLEVYALAALYSLGQRRIRQLGELAETLKQTTREGEARETQANVRQNALRAMRSNGSGWVNGWRETIP